MGPCFLRDRQHVQYIQYQNGLLTPAIISHSCCWLWVYYTKCTPSRSYSWACKVCVFDFICIVNHVGPYYWLKLRALFIKSLVTWHYTAENKVPERVTVQGCLCSRRLWFTFCLKMRNRWKSWSSTAEASGLSVFLCARSKTLKTSWTNRNQRLLTDTSSWPAPSCIKLITKSKRINEEVVHKNYNKKEISCGLGPSWFNSQNMHQSLLCWIHFL